MEIKGRNHYIYDTFDTDLCTKVPVKSPTRLVDTPTKLTRFQPLTGFRSP
jgi:hypothetical protein